MADPDFIHLPNINPDQLSPAVWAYIGDAVYELFIRYRLLNEGPAKTRVLHQETTTRVRASFQAKLVNHIESYLTASEAEILRRGRNVKCGHIPAHTDVVTYRYSTAFEALIGYLYLSGERIRLVQILNKALELEEAINSNI